MIEIAARIACVILVDPTGRLLLQLRDGNTANDPHTWAPPGGRIDPGEEPLAAAIRELEEETGLRVNGPALFWSGVGPVAQPPGAPGEFHVFYAGTTATDDDVVSNEGAAMMFVTADVVPTLRFGQTYSKIIPRFLASVEYATIIGSPPRIR